MILLENVTKTFPTGSSALTDLTLTVEKGEFVFLVGPSGSGKTTFLRLLIRQMLPTKGTIKVGDIDVVKLSAGKVPHLRKKIGVVFQDLKMLTDRTIYENIMLPLEMANVDQSVARKKVDEILEQVGIAEHKEKFPIQLSGGEQQRAAIARALVFSPEIILADEPTGNLDMTTSWEIIKLLQDVNVMGTTVIMATHNTDIVKNLLKRVVTLEAGKLLKDERSRGTKETQGAKGSNETKERKEEEVAKDKKEREEKGKETKK